MGNVVYKGVTNFVCIMFVKPVQTINDGSFKNRHPTKTRCFRNLCKILISRLDIRLDL